MRKLIIVATAVASLAVAVMAATAGSDNAQASFDLKVNPKFAPCLAKFPNDTTRPPTARVEVEKGDLNDRLELHLKNIKPGLAFDLFTVQRSTLDANGNVLNPAPSFGLAWYQSDVEADEHGGGDVKIKTVLVDQIFGERRRGPAEPDQHVPCRFCSYPAAQACGFDDEADAVQRRASAGPLAMISVPDAATGLGPLCLNLTRHSRAAAIPTRPGTAPERGHDGCRVPLPGVTVGCRHEYVTTATSTVSTINAKTTARSGAAAAESAQNFARTAVVVVLLELPDVRLSDTSIVIWCPHGRCRAC